VKQLFPAGVFALTSVVLAFGLSWIALYKLDFSYGFWHDNGGIAKAIEKYGPENYYRSGFAETTKAQRVKLFQQISFAVHHDGHGLETIIYQVPDHPTQTLLTKDEVGHLQDVANLVVKVERIVIAASGVWLLLVLYFAMTHAKPPSALSQFFALLAIMAAFTIALIVIGPSHAFSKMHEWVFPPGHPWFFYYQQSLMSTMMWAPVLFGWIALQWAVFTLLAFGGIQLGVSRLLRWISFRHQALSKP
jgi:hypothetical protein